MIIKKRDINWIKKFKSGKKFIYEKGSSSSVFGDVVYIIKSIRIYLNRSYKGLNSKYILEIQTTNWSLFTANRQNESKFTVYDS